MVDVGAHAVVDEDGAVAQGDAVFPDVVIGHLRARAAVRERLERVAQTLQIRHGSPPMVAGAAGGRPDRNTDPCVLQDISPVATPEQGSADCPRMRGVWRRSIRRRRSGAGRAARIRGSGSSGPEPPSGVTQSMIW